MALGRMVVAIAACECKLSVASRRPREVWEVGVLGVGGLKNVLSSMCDPALPLL